MLRIPENEIDSRLTLINVDNAGDPIYHLNGVPFTGEIEYYYEGGEVMLLETFKDGHLDGVQTEYWPNGNKKEECHIHFGRIDKYYKAWDEEGVLTAHREFNDGNRGEDLL